MYFDVYYVLSGKANVEAVKAVDKTTAKKTVKGWYPTARIIKADRNSDL